MRSLSRGRPQPRSAGAGTGLPWTAVVLALLWAGQTAAAATEFVMRDAEASASVLPTSFDFTLDTPSFSRTGSDHFHAGTELDVGGRYSLSRGGDPFGLVIGIDATSQAFSYDSEDFLFAYGARGSLGGGYAFNDDWSLAGEVGFTYGKTRLNLPGTSAAPAFSASGDYHSVDVRAVALYTVTSHVLVSAQLGYAVTTHDLTTNAGDSLTLTQKGLYIGLGVTWRLSTAPVRLE
jgi:hypothetical protein